MFEYYTKAGKDLFNIAVNNFKALPKTEADFKSLAAAIKTVSENDAKSAQTLFKSYHKFFNGTATSDDIAASNAVLNKLAENTRFAYLLAIPGTVFILPTLISVAKSYNVNLVPAEIAAEFSI